MWRGGHIGTSVSALVDGQLDAEAAERAWMHVVGCRSCRRLVEQEGRIKTELAALTGNEPSARLLGSLFSMQGPPLPTPAGMDAWAAVDEIERRGTARRRAGIALVGAGSAAAVFGFASLSGATLGIGGAPGGGTPTASLSRPSPSSAPATAVIAPAAEAHGRLPVRGTGSGGQRTAVAWDKH